MPDSTGETTNLPPSHGSVTPFPEVKIEANREASLDPLQSKSDTIAQTALSNLSAFQAKEPTVHTLEKIPKNNISEIIDRKGKEVLLSHVHEDKKDRVLEILSHVSDFVKNVKVLDNRVEAKVRDSKIKFKVAFDSSQPEELQVIFDSSVASQVKTGRFKKTGRAYNITERGVEPLMYTKERVGTKEEIGSRDSDAVTHERSTRREQAALLRNKEHNIPGTPKTHSVSYYVGKGGVVKQRIMQAFYTGGDLDSAIAEGRLDVKQKINIALQLSLTLSKFHEAGMSHNDYRPSNIVLDENKSPVLIDFGGTTNEEENTFSTGSARYFPPEMMDRKAFDALSLWRSENNEDELEASYDDLLAEREEVAEEYNQTKEKESKTAVALKNKIGEIDSRIDEVVSKLRELEDMVTAFRESVNLAGWVPQKNDDFDLGLTLHEMFGDTAPSEVQEIIDGLLMEDPAKRLTAADAFLKLQAISLE